MKVSKDKTENSQVFLTIELEPGEVAESLEKSYNRLVKKANIPGFRKGKAPRAVVERYLGKESLLEDALNHLVPQAYERAVSEQKIEAIARPQIDIVQTDPVIFKATIPLRPTVKLGDYHGLRLAPEPVEVTEDDVNKTLEQLRHQHATWEPVERPVELNDMVVLDVDSSIEDKPFINQKGAQYQVLKDLPAPMPGFAEQLLGMQRGEEREFKLKFAEDYPRPGFAGKEASFKVKVSEVKQEKLPELSDELASQIDAESKTLLALREKLLARLKERAEELAKARYEDQVIDAVAGMAQTEFPPVLVDVEIDQLIAQQLGRWQSKAGWEEYLKTINKTEAELREELRPVATKRVTRALVLDKVAEEEKIEVSDAEADAEIEAMIEGGENQEERREKLSSPQARESIRQMLTTRKTVQKLIETAKSPGSSSSSATVHEGGEK